MGEDGAGNMAGSLALADVAVMGMACPKHSRHVRLTRLIIGIGGAGAVAICLFAWPAAAYRPFDGTDAAVADLNQVEVELQPAGHLQTGPQSTLVAPEVVYNYGFAERWEMVLQGQVETPLSPGGPSSLAATSAFLKYVVKPGVLQGQSGISIATEFGPLLPGINTDPGVGFSWSGIVSQRWDWGTAHFNVEANLTRDQHGEAFLDVILEGPSTWKVRPVAEVFYDKVWTQTETRSVLAGAIWQVRDDLSFDAAYRYALVNGRPVNEIRAGLTFAFKVESDKTPTRPGVTFGNWGLSR
ncbi:MAG: hypothetical protein QOD56_1701 [Gammaproteobacteria bacterium]|nr:hypothetical protein [Gammaproteobacteria bacterium]